MISHEFFDRMKILLGDEYGAFLDSLSKPPVKGMRVNTVKCRDFPLDFEYNIKKIPYCDEGFIVENAEGIGNTPEHAAGMIYMQDPGAMSALSAVDIPRGALILDCCAAPGGKSTQAYAASGVGAFLVANEFVPKRAKICVSNFERLGIRDALVLSLDTAELAKMYSALFDLVICDAPCSGEGMLRKYDEASSEWTAEGVLLCAERQREILNNAAACVKAGGTLLYSTCTYSTEENEGVVLDFLDSRPDFSLVPISERLRPYVKEGIALSGREELRMCARFYPHISEGEGQFVAVLKRDENINDLPTILYKDASISPSREEERIAKAFLDDNLLPLSGIRLIKRGEFISIVPRDVKIPPKSVFLAGVCLGEIRGKNLFPHHHLFSAYGHMFKRRVELDFDDERVYKYLWGEEIATDITESGYCAVMYKGCALGGGKISGGVVKNHYPKGLRIKK